MSRTLFTILIALLSCVLSACTEPATPELKVIIGATLIRGSQPPLPNSVIIVKSDRIVAVGPQQMVPIPAGSTKVDAYGKFVAPAEPAGTLSVGSEANLLLLSRDPATAQNTENVERRMVGGRWVE